MKIYDNTMQTSCSGIKYNKKQLEKIISDVASKNFRDNYHVHLLQNSRVEYFYLLLNESYKRRIKLEIGCEARSSLILLEQLCFKRSENFG